MSAFRHENIVPLINIFKEYSDKKDDPITVYIVTKVYPSFVFITHFYSIVKVVILKILLLHNEVPQSNSIFLKKIFFITFPN
jgi:hypothetical protein